MLRDMHWFPVAGLLRLHLGRSIIKRRKREIMHPMPVQFGSLARRLYGSGPIARIRADGVERDIFDPSEYPEECDVILIYNQCSDDGRPVHIYSPPARFRWG
jgi:hypothetical protein